MKKYLFQSKLGFMLLNKLPFSFVNKNLVVMCSNVTFLYIYLNILFLLINVTTKMRNFSDLVEGKI